MRMEELLNILGNETRRDILSMLSERPCYVSQLSQELQIGQKAIIEHLELMKRLGILESRSKKIEKGRPRKYYGISQGVILEVCIDQDSFTVETIIPKIDEKILETMPKLKSLTKKIEKAVVLQGERKIEAMEEVLQALDTEEQRINEAKKVIRFLKNQVANEAKKEIIEEEMRNFF